MADSAAIARPYAVATFQIARDAGQTAAWAQWLEAAGMAVADESAQRLIRSPATDKDALVKMLLDVANSAISTVPPGDKANNLLRLLAENGRLEALGGISKAFNALTADLENRVEVTLTVASPVDDNQKAKIVDALKRRFGRDISLSVVLDEKLIGGARLQADDLVIDGSVSTGLAKLATAVAN